jgi:hypothetical protein
MVQKKAKKKANEQDHRAIKRRCTWMAFKLFRTAAVSASMVIEAALGPGFSWRARL